jgi:hypothetical protein
MGRILQNTGAFVTEKLLAARPDQHVGSLQPASDFSRFGTALRSLLSKHSN